MIIKLLLTLLISINIFASERATSTKIVQKVLSVIDKNDNKVWFDDIKKIHKLVDTSRLQIVKECRDASVLVLSTKNTFSAECCKKPKLVLDYDLLNYHTSVVSAFFWKKGRPNIIFLKKQVDILKIDLPQGYEKYLEDEIW